MNSSPLTELHALITKQYADETNRRFVLFLNIASEFRSYDFEILILAFPFSYIFRS